MDGPARAPSFSLRQLLYFTAAAEAGTIREAAARLHVTESAVSVAITELERAVKVQLCVRRRAHGVSLTPSGRSVLRRAQVLLRQAGELEAEASGGGAVLTGPLALGCYPSLGPTTLPGLLSGFGELHPGVVIDFWEDTQDQLHRRLADGELDLAIMYDLDLPPELRRKVLDVRQPHVLLSVDHPLAGADLDLAALESEPMVLLDAPPSSGHALRICELAGIRPAIRYRTGNFETARALVGRGLGWTLLVSRPQLDFSYEGLGVVAVEPVRPLLDPVRIVLAWPGDAALSPRAREFIRFVEHRDSDPTIRI
jgi:DNA-binding transcriptional LysR family regulator